MSTADAVWRLVSVGILWMAVHCAGMCGPLLLGLDVGGAARGASAGKAALRMLGYQGGRAVTYALLGALAGVIGGGLESVSRHFGAGLSVLLGVIAFARALRLLAPRACRHSSTPLVSIGGARKVDVAARLAAAARPLVLSTSRWRPALLGAVLGFLPCMIAYWALGLAATTGSAWGGAVVMLSLVVMTTPVIVAIGSAVRVFAKIPASLRQRLPAVLLAVSGLWLVLVGLAGAGIVPHAHVGLGGGYMIMLW